MVKWCCTDYLWEEYFSSVVSFFMSRVSKAKHETRHRSINILTGEQSLKKRKEKKRSEQKIRLICDLMLLEEEIKLGENCQRRNCWLSIFIIKGGGLKSAMEEHMEQMADLVLFQNLVASLLGGVEGKMVDLGGGCCCRVIWYWWISLTWFVQSDPFSGFRFNYCVWVSSFWSVE